MGSRASKTSARRQSLSRDARRRAAIAMRREEARRQAYRKAHRRRRRLVAVSVVVVLVLLGGGLTYALLDRGSSTANFTLTAPLASDTGAPFAITGAPTGYNLVYKLDTFGSSAGTNTQEIIVKRPFDAKLDFKTGAPPGGASQSSLVWTLGKYAQTTSGGTPEVSGSAPQAALGDMRLDAVLDDLVAKGTFVPREKRVVLGRECQVYRTGEALETFTITAPTKTDYADACIDSSGLMLEEVAVSSGQLSERVIATSVDDKTTPDDSTFAITGDPTPAAQGGTQLTPIDAGAAPVPGYWLLDAPPAGYQFQGRYQLQTPPNTDSSSDPSATTTTTTGPAPPVTSYVDVYVNGPKVITIRQGPTSGEPTSDTSAGGGPTVDLGPLGSANQTTSLSGSRLLAHPAVPASWYVEVMGTVSGADLQQIAKSLHT